MRFNRRKRNFVGFKVICALWAMAVAVWNAHPAQAAPFAYVGNDDSSVSVIDTAINEVVAKIPTAEPARSLAVSTDGKRVYVIGVRSFSVLGTSTNTVVSTVMVDTVEHVNLDRVAVAPDGKRAYVTGSFFDPSGPPSPANLVILVFDTVTKTVVARKKVDHVGKARGIAVSRDGKHVYVGCDECAGKLFVLDTDSNNVATINVPPDVGVSGIATAPDGKRVYVSDGSKLLVLDTATHEIRTIVTGFLGRVVAITSDGKHAYFLARDPAIGSSSVSVLDIARNTAATTSLPNSGLLEMAITPDGKRAYATGNGRVWVIDTTTNTVVDTLTGQNPAAVSTMPPSDGNVRVMTQNMNVGNIGTFRIGTPDAVAQFFTETVATNPMDRAAAIAKEIKANQPDLVALQEVSILRKGSGPMPNDPNIPATEVVHDQLQLLRDELARLGEHYDTVAVIPNTDAQLQSSSTLNFVVRLTDRTVILARANRLKLSNVQVEQFLKQPEVVSPRLAGRFGWGSVDVEFGDRRFRFVTTHLTPIDLQQPLLIAIQKAQALELIQSAGKTDLPVVYAGDFNTVAELDTYKILIGNSGRVDAWLKKNPTVSCPEVNPPVVRPGCTCCQNPKLNNTTSELSHRIDLVIVPPNTDIAEVRLVGADLADQTSSHLWPSDHAGLVAIFAP